ncbi:hypothetical protein AWM68_13065 [Fictibacillus phosphorivorans]|uniref:DUF1659 domain-containing protein n=1 Tax=Fictibacillus phosphorivorans TaxID=1221500 RepID=A0A163PRX8_9BACL|nr:DUF1659 domain-containing protein [Fictibacillus phosphorivorans]KZE64033.1 hypothetical protein AWM68_13065 [Fictibacillus phosphorivorans]
MATAALIGSSMRLELDGGLDADFKPVVKYKSFANVKTSATPNQLYTVGNALAGLQAYPLVMINRNDTFAIHS